MRHTVLIVGLGQIGMGYDLHLDPAKIVYTHARAFGVHPAFRLVGGVDPDEGRRACFVEAYGAPAYDEVGGAVAATRPDLVVIAVPTEFHHGVLQAVLAHAAPRLILCEKPLSYDLGEAQAMVKACAAKGTKLQVNYMRRSDPGVVEIRRRIVAGEMGDEFKGVVWYSKGLFHTGSHFFNLVQYWLGPRQESRLVRRGRDWDGRDPEPDAALTFERGTVVFLAAWEEAFSHYTVELVSRRGRLRYEEGGKRIEWQATEPDPEVPCYTVLSARRETIASGMDRYQWHVVEQLAQVLAGRPAETCDGDEALQTLIGLNQILQ